MGAAVGGVAPEQVHVHTTYLGGGFGRRFESDFVQEALETSKAANAPVKVVWSREDDTQHDFYRPPSVHRFQATLGNDRKPAAWTHRIVTPSIVSRAMPQLMQGDLDMEAVEGGMTMPYAVPNVHVDYVMAHTGIPVGFWRSVNNSFTVQEQWRGSSPR